jgi:iron complex transport system substrate-binding protein
VPYNNKMRSLLPFRLFRLSFWIFCLLLSPVAGQGAPPLRIISLNLCADQLLQRLAEPQQILGLSPLARDPALSVLAADALRYPTIAPKSELLLTMKPDLVLLAPAGQELLRAHLQENGIAVLTVKGWTTLTEGEVQIRELAQRLGRQEQGETLIAQIRQAMQDSLHTPPDATRSVLEIERRLYTPGRTSLIADLLRLWHIPNLADQPALQSGGFIALEQLLMLKPDRLIVSNGTEETSADDMGLALLRHPALLKVQTSPITVPARLTLCGGPATLALIETLSKALR